jgi:hypothetical protein
MQPSSSSQIVDSCCSFILNYDSCYVQDRRMGNLIGVGPRRHDGLWELDWLLLPSASTTTSISTPMVASTSSFQQWHHRLGNLCGSCFSSLVHRGVLGPVSGNTSLDFLGCRLGKKISSPILTSIQCSSVLLTSFIQIFGVQSIQFWRGPSLLYYLYGQIFLPHLDIFHVFS